MLCHVLSCNPMRFVCAQCVCCELLFGNTTTNFTSDSVKPIVVAIFVLAKVDILNCIDSKSESFVNVCTMITKTVIKISTQVYEMTAKVRYLLTDN